MNARNPKITIILNAAFFAVLGLFFLATITTYTPGAETGSFFALSIVSLLLMILGTRRIRIYSTLIFAVCLIFSYYGYQRGIEYQSYLNSKQFIMQMNNRILERK